MPATKNPRADFADLSDDELRRELTDLDRDSATLARRLAETKTAEHVTHRIERGQQLAAERFDAADLAPEEARLVELENRHRRVEASWRSASWTVARSRPTRRAPPSRTP